MNLWHVLPQIIMVVGAAVALLVAMFVPRQRQWLCAPVALLALAGAGTAQIALLGRPDQVTFDRLWALDATTGIATCIIIVVTMLTVVLAREWMSTDTRFGEYHVMLLLAALGGSVMVGAADLNELVVGVTLSSVTGYVLAAYHRRSPLALEAGMNYFLIGGLANLVLLIGVVFGFAAAATTLYADLSTSILTADPWLLGTAAVALVVGLAFKAGAVPAHAWVPDVAQGSPLPSAAFLTVVPKIGGILALARIVDQWPDRSGITSVVAVLAVASMTLGNLAALRQDDVRRLLGWSSVSQAGYALMGVVVVGRSSTAVPALLLFLATYAAANTAAFAVIGQLRGRTRLADYRGLARQRPWLAWTLTVALLSLVGIPPLGGFIGKLALFTAVVQADLGWLAAVAVVNTVISLFYYLRVIAAVHLEDSDGATVHVMGRWAGWAAGFGITLTVLLGPAGRLILDVATGRALVP